MMNNRSGARFEQWANRSVSRFAFLVPLFALAMACGGSLSASAGVNIASPQTGATVSSPVQVSASVTGHQIKALQLYVDTKLAYSVSTTSFTTSQSLAAGSHRLVVQAIDTKGNIFSKAETITVTSSPTTTPPVAVSISPTTAVLQVSKSQQFSSSVSGTTDTAVTWKVNGVIGGNSTVGQISTAGDYVVPAAVPSGGAVTVTAQSQADPTVSANAAVTITSAATTVTVAVSPTSASVTGGTTKQFTATVSGTTNTAVTWGVNGVTGGNTTYGTISSSGVYTAPACPSTSSATVTATSVYDTTAKANAAVTVSGSQSAGTGGNYYVAQNGSDSNSGSACSPWATIHHASTIVGPGSTVHVAPGNYAGPIQTNASGSSSARIRFVSDVKWGAVITDTTGDTAVWLHGSYGPPRGGDYVDIDGFDITGNSPNGIMAYGAYDRILNNRVHDLVVGCDGNGGSGINLQNINLPGGYNEVSGNVVFNVKPPSCTTPHGYGIYFLNPYGVAYNNIVYGNGAGGIQLWHGGTNAVIAHNLIFNNGTYGIVMGCGDNGCGTGTWGTGPTSSDYNTVNNNLIFNNPSGGIREYTSSGYGAAGPHSVFYNNILYNNGSANLSLISTTVSGNVTSVSPSSGTLFVNWQTNGSGDYHLKSGSPAIDSGSTTCASGTSKCVPANAYDGGNRPVNSVWDIGPFEYGSVAGNWPW
jgi:hypothetical protein